MDIRFICGIYLLVRVSPTIIIFSNNNHSEVEGEKIRFLDKDK
jgi:hypothetical protein